MKNKIITLGLCLALTLSITACGGKKEQDSEATPATVESDSSTGEESAEEAGELSEKEEAAIATYQDVVDDYTEKMKETASRLAEEYNKEAEAGADSEKLAEIAAANTQELVTLCLDGVTAMAEYKTDNDSEYGNYEEWAGKLQDIYTQCAADMTNAYVTPAN